MKHLVLIAIAIILCCCQKVEEQTEPQFRRSPFRTLPETTISIDLKTGGSCTDGFSYCSHSMDGEATIGETNDGLVILSWPSDSISNTFYFHKEAGVGGYIISAGKFTLFRTPHGYNYVVMMVNCDVELCEVYDCRDCDRWTLRDNEYPL